MDTNQQLPQLETYNKDEQQIKEVLDLDLNDHSRLKRGTGLPIVIHKRRKANEKEMPIMVNKKSGGGGNTL